MRSLLSNIFYSFPIQLLILHLRSNLLLVFIWVLIALLFTGKVASKYGAKYLFLDPEYLGQVNPWSFLILGITFGGFFMTWNLTTYLLNAHYFPFLASLARPFTKFCINNAILPLAFLIAYFVYVVDFQTYYQYWTWDVILFNCLSFLVGGIISVLLVSVYLTFTNKDIQNFIKKYKHKPPNLVAFLMPGRRIPYVETSKPDQKLWKIKIYLSETLRPRIVRSVAHYDTSMLLNVFKQNHINALILQSVALLILLVFGYFIDNPYCRIPAGSSVFLLASILVSLIGAVTYWFEQWRLTVFIGILFFINVLTSYDIFNHQNKAYGLDYNQGEALYNYSELDASSRMGMEEDKENIIKALDNWRAKFGKENPKMAMICVSGGGMKASVWAMQVLQEADRKLEGDLLKNTMLMSGASGGLIGMAYLRELYWQQQQGANIDIYDKQYLDNISKDLLNSLTFTIVSNDLFLPWREFEVDGHTYHKDRGYIFEKQLNENTDFILDKKLSDYRQAEQDGSIPLLYITPSIVNDGRRLIISSQGASFMTMSPIGQTQPDDVIVDAVDFGRLFSNQDADNLRLTTALRMNATYPYILPNVYLPSEPAMEVMDAGFRDNMGVKSAVRFINVFKDWIKENTAGVVMVQIVGKNRINDLEPTEEPQGLIESLLNPLGIVGQILSLQEYENDTSLGMLFDLLGKDHFDVIRFTYEPSDKNEEASMTFHLTKREKKDIQEAIYLPENQANLTRLENVIQSVYPNRVEDVID